MDRRDFRILCLDGGGSKGVYTLGVLHEVEAMVGGKLYEHFDLLYGVSTGSIIVSSIALGESIADIEGEYFKLIPMIMGVPLASIRTTILKQKLEAKFGEKKFDDFLIDCGIVATNMDSEKPMVFKRSKEQSHSMVATFEPGFGCTIAEAVLASCSAYPFFDKIKVDTKNEGQVQLIDGGFVGNNPVLFSLIDAIKTYRKRTEDIRILSVGTGRFLESTTFFQRLVANGTLLHLIPKMFSISSNTIELVGNLLFPDVKIVRINEAFATDEYRTSFLERDITKLKKIRQLGRQSFSKYEKDINALLKG